MIKISFDNRAYLMQHQGGVSRYWYEIQSGLQRLGCFLHTFDTPNRNIYMRKLGSRLYFQRFPPKTTRAINLMSNIYVDFALSKSKSDIHHKTYFGRSHFKIKAPSVITVFDMIHEIYPESVPAWDPAVRFKRLNCMVADHIIAISHSTKSDLIKHFGIASEKISVIHFGNSFASESFLETEPEKYFVFVGNRAGYKNFSNTLCGFAQSSLSSEYSLLCVGGGPPTTTEVNLSIKLGIADRVKYLPHANDAELALIYQKSSGLVYTSLYEGFGLPIIEAQAKGCPVLTGLTSSLPEVAGLGAIYADCSEPDAIAKGLEDLLCNRQKLRQLGFINAKKFRWEDCVKQTLGVYEKLRD